MKKFTAIIEKDLATGLYVGYIPNMQGAHSQGKTLDELYYNLKEVIEMVLESKESNEIESEFIGVQQITIENA
jgi:predicted RNase H-like HicB family nuclease